jgi:hypothetical protein
MSDIDEKQLPAEKADADTGELIVPLDENATRELVDKINRLYSVSRLELFLEVGELVCRRVFGGDVDRMKKSRKRDENYRRVMNDDRLTLGKAELSRSLGVFALDAELKAEGHGGLAALQGLSASHFAAVLGLEFKTQRGLLTRAEKGSWTSKKMEQEAAKKRAKLKAGERRGRPPLPAFQKTVHRFRKMLGEESTFGGTDDIASMGPDEALELHKTVTGMKLKLEELQQKLQERATGFVSADE